MEPVIREVTVKSVITKSNLPVSDYSVNPYTGCKHSCKYCYASFMKRFTGHTEPWGCFLGVKYWPEIRNPEKFRGRNSSYLPLQIHIIPRRPDTEGLEHCLMN